MQADRIDAHVHQRGVATLGPLGFTYDLLILPRHAPAAAELVRKLPGQRFVVDHLGLPDIRGHQLAPRKAAVEELAACPNVFCKLSGLAFRADWRRWRPEDFTRYLDVALELFGPTRLMIGSNWPVCTVAGAYDAVLDVVFDRIGRLSDAEQAQILGRTCADFYGLHAHAS